MRVLSRVLVGVLFFLLAQSAQSSPLGYPSASICTSAVSGGGAGSTALTPGRWGNPNRAGTGWEVMFAQNGQHLGLYWYTYGADNRPIWYSTTFQAFDSDQTWAAQLTKHRRVNRTQSSAVVGDLAVRRLPQDPTRLAIRWRLGNGPINDECIQDFGRTNQRVGETVNPTYNGLWHEPAFSGYGIGTAILDRPSFGTSESYEIQTLLVYDTLGEPVWLSAEKSWPTSAPPADATSTANMLRIDYLRSTYAGGVPQSNCTLLDSCTNRVNGVGTLRRRYNSAISADWRINVNAAAFGQSISWLRPADQSDLNVYAAGEKLTDHTQILVNRTGCTIATGQSTCDVRVSWGGFSQFESLTAARRNLDNQQLIDLPGAGASDLLDKLPPGRFQYELRTSFGAVLARSAIVTITKPQLPQFNQIGIPAIANCSNVTVPVGQVPFTAGRWFNPLRKGTGWDFTLIDGVNAQAQKLQGYWYTFDAQKRPMWLSTLPNQIQTAPNGERTWWSPLLSYSWNNSVSAANAAVPVGEVSIRFLPNDPTRMALRWRWNAQSSSALNDECVADIARAAVRAPEVNPALSGLWYERGFSGYGYQLSIAQTPTTVEEVVALAVYDTSGAPVWVQGQVGRPTGPSFGVAGTLNLNYFISPFANGFPTNDCSGATCAVQSRSAGSVNRTFINAASLQATINIGYSGEINGINQNINWQRPLGASGIVN